MTVEVNSRKTTQAKAKIHPAQSSRLDHAGLIDRSQTINFQFDGRAFTGYRGDTLASALIANGVRLVGRSFKYHRPRGVFTAGSEEPNALVELRSGARREPNTKATTVELSEGLEGTSQNRWPSLRFDLLSVNSALSALIPAGFYYKTFMWPAKFWETVYEPTIRRAAGLGRASGLEDPDTYEQAYAFCDVLVIGAGPSGLAAALAAGRAGARVILCDEDFRLGGRLLSETLQIDDAPGHLWAGQATAELMSLSNVRVMARTTIFGAFDGSTYGALERVSDHLAAPPEHVPRQRLWRIVSKRTVLAAGAIERSIAFAGNDRPGIMTASAVRTYLNRFAACAGQRLVVFTCCDDGWRCVRDAKQAGVEVVALIEARTSVSDSVKSQVGRDCRILMGSCVVSTSGSKGLGGLTVRTPSGMETIAADALAVSGGWNPNIAVSCHLGGRPDWNDVLAAFVPSTAPEGMSVAGAASGKYSLAACLQDGSAAGAAAADAMGRRGLDASQPHAEDEPVSLSPVWHITGGRGKAFLDLQNDVTVNDVQLADREGYSSLEHIKRYTTLGMATDQGKTANVTALAILAQTRRKSIPEVGTTRFRPPYVPVAVGAFAGHHRGRDFRPTRLPPTHGWAQEEGAVFVEAGPWLRAQYYPKSGERDWLESVNREVLAVRHSVGFCDVSTLGKIDVQGPDAGVFLDRLYINTFSTLPVGRARYGMMLREDGFVMDDGTSARLAVDRFIVTTTTANGARVYQHMQFCHQVLWPELDMQFVSITDQWAQLSVAGPRARETLRSIIDPSFDLADAAFPFMAARELTAMGGIPARLFRISFSGELAYEIAVPARFGDALARRLMVAGRDFAITPYGTEALGVMRIEKGHVAGNEIDGRTTAADLGLGRMMSKKKDFIGRVLSGRPGLVAQGRMELAGFKPVDQAQRLRAGAHFLPIGAAAEAANDQGVMTSVAFSPTLGHWIGLGLIVRAPGRIGERVRAYDPVRNGDVEVEVCAPCFIDQEGHRLHG